jgi:hypothetical protein
MPIFTVYVAELNVPDKSPSLKKYRETEPALLGATDVRSDR